MPHAEEEVPVPLRPPPFSALPGPLSEALSSPPLPSPGECLVRAHPRRGPRRGGTRRPPGGA
eukprot:4738498-Pyramimonas_sp.AAC.1